MEKCARPREEAYPVPEQSYPETPKGLRSARRPDESAMGTHFTLRLDVVEMPGVIRATCMGPKAILETIFQGQVLSKIEVRLLCRALLHSFRFGMSFVFPQNSHLFRGTKIDT
jgi:hypothetical protein